MLVLVAQNALTEDYRLWPNCFMFKYGIGVLGAVALVWLCATLWFMDKTENQSQEDPGKWRFSWAKTDNPERDLSWKTKLILESIGPRPGMRIADVGAGAGYFAFKLASLVGERGKVFATDIDPEMVSHLKHEKKKRGTRNLQVIRVAGQQKHKLGLKPRSVDAILLVNLFYPFYNSLADTAAKFLEECHKALVPGGRVVLTNDKIHPPRGDCGGPREHLCGDLSLKEVKELAQRKFEIMDTRIIRDSRDNEKNEQPGYLLVLKK